MGMLRTYVGPYYTDIMFYNTENLKKFVVPNFTHRIRTRNALWYKAQRSAVWIQSSTNFINYQLYWICIEKTKITIIFITVHTHWCSDVDACCWSRIGCKIQLKSAASAQWICLRQSSCHPGFKSQTHHLHYYHLLSNLRYKWK